MHKVGDVIEVGGVNVRVTEVDADGNVVATEPIAPAPVETAEQRIARLEAENQRLAGENDGLRARPALAVPAPAPTAAPETPEGIVAAHAQGRLTYGQAAVAIDALYNGMKLTDRARVEAIADLRNEERFRERDAATARLRTETEVKARMRTLLANYADLKDSASKLVADVNAELDDLVKLGRDPEDLATQVIAIEKVIGRAPTSSTHEFNRRHIPAGGGPAGGGPPAPTAPTEKPRGQQIYERMTTEAQQFYQGYHSGNIQAIYSALNHADEGVLTRAGRFVR